MSNEYVLHLVRNPDELYVATAERIVALIQRTHGQREWCSIALGGGSTPRRLFALLATEYRVSVDWAHVRFFWGDERPVSADHEDSNFRMANETLLQPLGVDDAQVHRIQGEHPDLHASALEYEQTIRSHVTAQQSGIPSLDLVLLGMGSDAHTASLFPQTAAITERERLVVSNFVPKLDTHRLTMTYPLINAAQTAMFVVLGSAKAQAMAQVLEGPKDIQQYPSQGIGGDVAVEWWADAGACAQLTR